MMTPDTILTFSAPAARLKEALSQTGFVRDSAVHGSTYRTELEFPSGSVYVFQVPFEEEDGSLLLDGETSFFDGVSDSEVPEEVRESAMKRLLALRSRIESHVSQSYSPDRDKDRKATSMPTRSVASAENGRMVQDFDDMRALGKDMQRVKTGQQLQEQGLLPDPIQH
ncbi:hypothetical protein E5161_08960 [Cohnella pontilimi]|uniref:Uncharacterized protein n=1 Tax=Cohnella pontilimi TaxID=2564100 RepID=A0A4U0FBQ0_9BACL|nr:hypothetical protein [Cohnella pontilimi]TJY42131.1 hypothetical protein E5161_08960 [Cohnella pontilimi]